MKCTKRQRAAALLTGIGATVAILASAGSAGAAVTCDKVASPTGSDSAAGTAQAPYRTATQLVASISAGQTGCLRAGTFVEPLSVRKAGLTLTSYPGERATLKGDLYVSAQGSGTTVSNLNLDGRGTTNTPSPVVNGDNVTFDNDDVTNYQTAICFVLGNSEYGRAHNTVIENSNIHDCGKMPATGYEHGIYLDDSDHAVIRNNWIHHNAGYGLHFFPDGDNTMVTGNVIDSNGSGVIFSGEFVDGVYETSDNNVIEHNLITNSDRSHNVEDVYPQGQSAGRGNVVTENCIAGANGWYAEADGSGIAHPQEGFSATNNLVADPRYVNADAGNYHLQSGSPCASILAGGDTTPGMGPENDPPGTPPSGDTPPAPPQTDPTPPQTAPTPPQTAPTAPTKSTPPKKHRKRATARPRKRHR